MSQIIQQLKNSNRILVASHTNPDGDAIGSLIAMGMALEALRKSVTLYNESPIPAVYRFLPSVGKVICSFDDQPYDLAVILDCGNIERVGKHAAQIKKLPVIINIDHHVTNTHFGHYHFIDPEACASSEIVYTLVKDLGVSITRDMATAIYTGILTDTGSFRFSNTNQQAFAVCQEMIARGVDPSAVAKRVYGTYSLGRIKLLNLALDTIELARNGKVSMMTLTPEMMEETGTRPEDVDGLINYARSIEDVRLAVLIEQKKNNHEKFSPLNPYHVSLRSDGSVDVSAIASVFGGGGHQSAAGFNVDSATPADIKSKIIQMTENL